MSILAASTGDVTLLPVVERCALAANTSTPLDMLELLAGDEDAYARASAAGNTSAPLEILAMLAKDEKWFVRASIAVNPSAPQKMLSMLAKDKDASVRRYAKNNLNKRAAA